MQPLWRGVDSMASCSSSVGHCRSYSYCSECWLLWLFCSHWTVLYVIVVIIMLYAACWLLHWKDVHYEILLTGSDRMNCIGSTRRVFPAAQWSPSVCSVLFLSLVSYFFHLFFDKKSSVQQFNDYEVNRYELRYKHINRFTKIGQCTL